MDLALAVERLSAGELVEYPLREALGGSSGLLHGVLPVASELHDLGAMDQAEAIVGHHLGLGVAPSRQGIGPFPRVAQFVCVPTKGDRVAVDDAGDDRRELAGGGGDEHLVDQPQTVSDPSLLDQGTALVVPREPQQVPIAEPLGDPGGLGRGVMGGLVVAGAHLLEPDRDQ